MQANSGARDAGGIAAPEVTLEKVLASTSGNADAAVTHLVLTAFQNVADALQALDTDADALGAAARAESAAQKSLGVVQHQLELGSVSYLALVNAEQTYQQASISLTQARANRYADTAALFQALGGSITPMSAAPAVARENHSWRASSIDEAIDETPGSGPDGCPLRENAATLVGNAIVAAGRTGIGGHDAAGQEIRGR